MKKIYLLSLLCCLGFAAFSQTTATIYSTGATGSYTSGTSTSTTRSDNNIVCTSTTQSGYTVFDLTSIPAGSFINSCTIGFYVITCAGTGTPSGWNTIGFPGDLSTVTAAATLFGDMAAPPGTSISTATYGTTSGANVTIASTAAIKAFIQANCGTKFSLCWTGGAPRTYTIRGESGSTTSTTVANHAPYLTINYCPPPSSVTATAVPTSLCQGDALSLTGTGAGTGTLSWSWAGPDGFTATSLSASDLTGITSSGVYTLTATNTCATGAGVTTGLTVPITVNPLPTAITGPTDICTGANALLTGTPPGGTWISGSADVTIVSGTGVATGVSAGLAPITYTLSTGCFLTGSLNDNDPPGAIGGSSSVCIGTNINLTDPVGGDSWTWISDLPATASVDPLSGVVSGNAVGVANISYLTGGCVVPAVYPVTVVALPSPITGLNKVCVGSSIILGDTSPGGVWASSDASVASIDPGGVVIGLTASPVNITYTDPATTCLTVTTITVNPLPPAIGGPPQLCLGSIITLTEVIGLTGVWSGGSGIASIGPTTGSVSGLSTGAASFTFTATSTGCAISTTISVDPVPAAISGTAVLCQGTPLLFTDASPGGTWTSSVPGTATVGSSSGTVTGVASGTGSIVYTLPTTCSVSKPITVNPAPASSVTAGGPTTFCAGGNVVLTGPITTGITYQWDDDGVPVPGATNSFYTATSTGSYALVVTNTLTCSATSLPVVVSAAISAVLSNASPLVFCIGNHTQLSVSTAGAVGTVTYQWDLNGAVIPSATDSTYNASVGGLYSVIANISGGSGSCSVVSDTVAVNVHPLPTPAISYNGMSLTTSSGYSAFQWYFNTVGITGASSYAIIPHSNGEYQVLVTDGNGCKGFSGSYLLTNVGVGQVVNEADIKIAPNPATSVLHIESPVIVRAIVTGIEGKVLADQANAQDINISSLPAGLYLISLYDENDNRVLVRKFIKE